MFGLLPFQFRFRGKIRRLLDLYVCFVDNDGAAMHPSKLARITGISLTETNRRLAMTPELFVKLPKRPDGYTRYRLTTVVSSMDEDAVVALIERSARKETFMLYAVMTMLLMLGLIMLIVMTPAL